MLWRCFRDYSWIRSAMRRYTVDGRGVRSFDDFVAAMNAGFVQPAVARP